MPIATGGDHLPLERVALTPTVKAGPSVLRSLSPNTPRSLLFKQPRTPFASPFATLATFCRNPSLMRLLRSLLLLPAVSLALAPLLSRAQAPASTPAPTRAPTPRAVSRATVTTRLASPRGPAIRATPAQTALINKLIATLEPYNTALATARDDLALTSYTLHPSDPAQRAAAEKVALAELALATARRKAFTDLQQGPTPLPADQLPALIALLTQPPASAFTPGPFWTFTPATPPSSRLGAPTPTKK